MNNVLVLSYHYPPVGGAAVQRNAQLVRHLPQHGYQPVVVTGAAGHSGRWTPRDDSLERDAMGDFEILRVGGEDNSLESGRWRGRRERWLGAEKPWSRWWTQAVVEASRTVSSSIDLVYAPLVPYDAFRAAIRVGEMLKRPLVLDLHDPWAFDEMMVYPSRVHRLRAARLMRQVLSAGDGIVLNTPEAAARLLHAFPELTQKPLATIPNGYSAEDFVGDAPMPASDAFRIVHTGYLHTELGQEHRRLRLLHDALGGTLGGVDIMTRSHVYLLQALDQLLTDEPDLGPVELHLAGVVTPADRDAAGDSGFVHFHGYVPHDESVRLLRSADLLFLPMHNVAAGWRVGIIPGKTYEYIAARRPILAAVPPGDAHDLLRSAGNAAICDPADVVAMRRELRAAINRKRQGKLDPRPNDSIVEGAEWRNRSRDLAQLFDETLATYDRNGSVAATTIASTARH